MEFDSLNVHQMLLRLLINEKFEWEKGKYRRIGEGRLEENHFLDDERTRGIYHTQLEKIDMRIQSEIDWFRVGNTRSYLSKEI